jgi:hypothetical protein
MPHYPDDMPTWLCAFFAIAAGALAGFIAVLIVFAFVPPRSLDAQSPAAGPVEDQAGGNGGGE